MSPIVIGVLASGGGTNLQAILDSVDAGRLSAHVAVVISNNSTCGAMERARNRAIPAIHLSRATVASEEELDRAVLDALKDHLVQLVVLAGYMKKVGPQTIQAYRGRILNIHPALLPAFGGAGMYGRRVHEAVIASGASVSGVTVHLVDENYDHGPVVAQREVPVCAGDTAETLAARVLGQEHVLYPQVIQWFAERRVRIEKGQVRIDE